MDLLRWIDDTLPVMPRTRLEDLFLGPETESSTASFRTARSTETFGRRRYRSLELDPFCTDASFFGSGRYRPTAYARREDGDDRNRAPNVVPRRDPRRGPYTGAARPDYPRVHRKFGDNTRQRVMPFRRYTHMRETGYDDDVVGSQPLPSFLPATAALGQSGSEAVLASSGLARTLGPGTGRTGARHFLLDGSH